MTMSVLWICIGIQIAMLLLYLYKLIWYAQVSSHSLKTCELGEMEILKLLVVVVRERVIPAIDR